jgi:hypothetical protein
LRQPGCRHLPCTIDQDEGWTGQYRFVKQYFQPPSRGDGHESRLPVREVPQNNPFGTPFATRAEHDPPIPIGGSGAAALLASPHIPSSRPLARCPGPAARRASSAWTRVPRRRTGPPGHARTVPSTRLSTRASGWSGRSRRTSATTRSSRRSSRRSSAGWPGRRRARAAAARTYRCQHGPDSLQRRDRAALDGAGQRGHAVSRATLLTCWKE